MILLSADECANGVVVRAPRRRGVDILTAQEDGYEARPDRDVLNRASELGRVLFSQDRDLLVEAAILQRAGVPFRGLVYARQSAPAGICIDDLELIATAAQPADFENRVEHVPL